MGPILSRVGTDPGRYGRPARERRTDDTQREALSDVHRHRTRVSEI